jgi:hypothetical protein
MEEERFKDKDKDNDNDNDNNDAVDMTDMSSYELSKTVTENTYMKVPTTTTTTSESIIQTTADNDPIDAVNTALVEHRSQSSSDVCILKLIPYQLAFGHIF